MCCLWQHFCLLTRHQANTAMIACHPIYTQTLLLTVQVCQTQVLLSALIHRNPWEKPPQRILSKKPANWNKLCRLNTTAPLRVLLVVFLSLISWASNLPHLKVSSKETCRNVHLISLTLMANAGEKNPQERQLTVQTIINLFLFFFAKWSCQKPCQSKIKFREYCATHLGHLEQLPRT